MLTTDQLAILKADIEADPLFQGWFAEEISQEYRKPAVPTWHVYRTSMSPVESREAILKGGGASQLDALTAGKRDSLLWLINDQVNPSIPEVRAALDDLCGSQNTLKASLKSIQYRTATRGEKLFSSGTGTVASPATVGYELPITYQDVEAAMRGYY